MSLKNLLRAGLAALSLTLLPAIQAHAQTQGRDFSVVEPAVPTDSAGKIEVLEFFSYGCSHCADLYPVVKAWGAKKPGDVELRRVHVTFGNPYYTNLSKLYYALEAIGELKRLDESVFTALHQKGLKLVDDKSILDWVGQQGVDQTRFAQAYNSFGVVSKVKRGDQLAHAAKIRGTPSILVDGRYLMLNDNIRSHADLLANTDKVIEKVRAERNLKPKK